jgi:hypothetical protein
MVLMHRVNLSSLRRLHTTLYRKSNVPMSRYEPNSRLPYDKLEANLAVVRKR